MADAGDQGDVLLQLALDRLLEGNGVASLTFAAYDELSGLAGKGLAADTPSRQYGIENIGLFGFVL